MKNAPRIRHIIATILLFLCFITATDGFLISHGSRAHPHKCPPSCVERCAASKRRRSAARMVQDGKQQQQDLCSTNTTQGDAVISEMYQSLQNRQDELERNVGRRYITRTQKGFLNVHQEPSDPFDTHNIIDQLAEGQIVESIAPSRGAWIHHDRGGWSISKFGGFTWLELIEE
eukprot:CAMPEP_0198131002 /NCGR_PEP_ID=MMETSP1442-20131203/55169_1 /TAXON_ID= /ORGANISM="Craspedostauros australis, Strain CCMP3328" /LENGTH=173 /DNA_ID=CAMNT_0043791729 /DNA_START=17 /DNA_END=538 /DNA_ORIENTATION=+